MFVAFVLNDGKLENDMPYCLGKSKKELLETCMQEGWNDVAICQLSNMEKLVVQPPKLEPFIPEY